MRKNSIVIPASLFFILILSRLVYSQENLTADEIIRRSQAAFYYPGSDMKARVLMKLITKDGRERIRDFTMLRKNLDKGGEQRYFIYFYKPPDVKDTYVIKSVPKDEGSVDYSYKVSWIDKESFIPLKEEYYDKRGELYKVFTADEVKEIQDFPTATKRTMKNVQSSHRTEVTFEEVGYNNGIGDEIFSERYLRNPPQKWIR